MGGGIKLLGHIKTGLKSHSKGLFFLLLLCLLNCAAVEAQTAQTEYQVIRMPDGGLVKAKLVNVSWTERNTVLGGWSKIWRSSADPDQLVVYEWQGRYARVDWNSLDPRSQYTGRNLKLVEVLTPQEAAKYPIDQIPVWHSGKEYYPEITANLPVIGQVTTKPAETKEPGKQYLGGQEMPENAIYVGGNNKTTNKTEEQITKITGTEKPTFIPLAPAESEKPVTAAPEKPAGSAINIIAIVLSAMFIVLVGLVIYLLTKKNLYLTLLICVVMSFMAALPYLV